MTPTPLPPPVGELTQRFPWLMLFKAPNQAANPGKVLLGAAAALLLAVGWWVIGAAFPPPAAPTAEGDAPVPVMAADPLAAARVFPWERGNRTPSGSFRALLQDEGAPNFSAAALVAEPPVRLAEPFRIMLQGGWRAGLFGLLAALWTIVVAALCGGAACRMTALEVCRDTPASLSEALAWAREHLRGYALAPALPLAAAAIIVALGALGGALAWVPGLNVLAGIAWPLALLAGLVLAVALFGLALTWPLMHPAISVEGTEGIDAVTRSFSYLINRPWQYLWYLLVAAFAGAVALVIAAALAFGTVRMSQYAASWGMGAERARQMHAAAPEAGGWRASLVGAPAPEAAAGTVAAASWGVGLWTHAAFLALLGYAYSYFWTAGTMIYLLLRQDVDEVEISEIDLPAEDPPTYPAMPPAGSGTPSAPAAPSGLQIVTIAPAPPKPPAPPVESAPPVFPAPPEGGSK